MADEVVLHDYWRSSAAYRVRIALNLKGVAYRAVEVDLVAGDQRGDDYRALNPLGLIPLLEIDGHRISQSLAIIDYLEETHPEPALLPADSIGRAQVRAAAQVIACDIHPVNNLNVLSYLKGPLAVAQPAVDAWYAHFITEGFAALEQLIAPGRFCFGDQVTLADLCLVPQVFNARRFNVPLEAFPRLVRIADACLSLDAFRAASPEVQPDAG